MPNNLNFKGFQQEYHFENIHLYQADCLEMLKQIPDKYYSLTIADPPYGFKGAKPNQVNFRYLNTKTNYENISPSKEYFDLLFKISENQIIWGGNYFTDKLPVSRCWICWNKGEQMKSFSDFELAWGSFNAASKFVKLDCNRHHADVKITGPKIHQNQKPISLYKWILQRFTKAGDKIVDTHLGGGSIIIACYLMDFELTAFEIEENTFNEAVKRFEKYKKRPKGFFNESDIFRID
jgi:site-specific DNA-methyltransferase (adenine-specific)